MISEHDAVLCEAVLRKEPMPCNRFRSLVEKDMDLPVKVKDCLVMATSSDQFAEMPPEKRVEFMETMMNLINHLCATTASLNRIRPLKLKQVYYFLFVPQLLLEISYLQVLCLN